MSRVETLKSELTKTKKELDILVQLIAYMAGRLNLCDLDNEDPNKTLVKVSNEFTEMYGYETIHWTPDVPYDPSKETFAMQILDDGTLKRVTKADLLENLAQRAREKETDQTVYTWDSRITP